MTESNSIVSLQLASLDMDVDIVDTITISGHCMQLDYYSIQPMWGSHDLIFCPIILAFFFSSAHYHYSQIMCGSLWLPMTHRAV